MTNYNLQKTMASAQRAYDSMLPEDYSVITLCPDCSRRVQANQYTGETECTDMEYCGWIAEENDDD